MAYRGRHAPTHDAMSGDQLLAENRRFYDGLWAEARLIGPERFNTWALVAALASGPGARLEVGPGLRPRLPMQGTVFADISLFALSPLREAGGRAAAALVTALPFADASFTVVCAMDIVEHVADDAAAFAELARVAAPGAVLLLSVPLHANAWTEFDAAVGHHRRYDPPALLENLARVGFVVERSAASGMLPRSSRLKGIGMWFLKHQKARAMWWYNRVFMPLSLWRAGTLTLSAGFLDTDGVAGVLLICRKGTQTPASQAVA
jgi:SAM-dependent methyltransferase